jgi:hypothetical protein
MKNLTEEFNFEKILNEAEKLQHNYLTENKKKEIMSKWTKSSKLNICPFCGEVFVFTKRGDNCGHPSCYGDLAKRGGFIV